MWKKYLITAVCILCFLASVYYMVYHEVSSHKKIEALEKNIVILQADREQTEAALKRQRDIENFIARNQNERGKEIEDALSNHDVDYFDELLRILERDDAARDNYASGKSDGAVPGSGK